MTKNDNQTKIKRPKFLTIFLIILLVLSITQTLDALTYVHFIFLTKSYLSLLGILAGFGEVLSLVLLLRWEKRGVAFLISSMVVIFLVTAIDEFNLVTNVNQIIISTSIVLALNFIILGILYFAIKPVWKNFK